MCFWLMALRLPATWMKPIDDRLLEYLDEEGTSTPKTIADDSRLEFDRQYIGTRLRTLHEAELVEKVGRGVYTIDSKGRRYLAGQEDLRDEPDPS